MKKKIKDLTLEEVNKICRVNSNNDLEENVENCLKCPFFNLTRDGEKLCYCPLGTDLSYIIDLVNEEIEVEVNENI